MTQRHIQLGTIAPSMVLNLPPPALLSAVAEMPVEWTFYEGEPADMVALAPTSDKINGGVAELKWNFAGLNRDQICLVVESSAANYAASGKLDPAITGAVARVAVSGSTGGAVGQVQIAFTTG